MSKKIYDAYVLPTLTKKQRNALMRERNKAPVTGGDDYYHKHSAHTIIKWLLSAAGIAFVICGIMETVK